MLDSHMSSGIPESLTGVAQYYSAKLMEHGQTAQGVDWNGEDGHALRFKQLCKVIEQPSDFSVNDLGCGYGALYDYLSCHYRRFLYAGIDISSDMISAARDRFSDKSNVTFAEGGEPPTIADYGVASGIFNVRLTLSNVRWREHLQSVLDSLNRTSTRGFAFNCLTSYSDADKMRDYLYYADPSELFDLCKRRYSRHVALLHDYGLYEFSILVRKVL